MFASTHFNRDISEWDVSSVTDMEGMFANAGRFDGDSSKWDVDITVIPAAGEIWTSKL